MRSRLREILVTGRAPGFNTKATDPTGPDRAVPKAFKDLEQKQDARSIAKAAGFSVKRIKEIWKM